MVSLDPDKLGFELKSCEKKYWKNILLETQVLTITFRCERQRFKGNTPGRSMPEQLLFLGVCFESPSVEKFVIVGWHASIPEKQQFD